MKNIFSITDLIYISNFYKDVSTYKQEEEKPIKFTDSV